MTWRGGCTITFADSDPAVWPSLALAHAVYRQRQATITAIGFDEAGMMDGWRSHESSSQHTATCR